MISPNQLLLTRLTVAALGVGAFSLSANASPIVDGSTISWPDDGYYQVQRANDFVTECEGTPLCVVDAGEYIVINHTTGQRFENVVVTGASSGSDLDYQLVGNTFTFPEGNWFQVQETSTYTSVCNGASSCDVESGQYVVINHTSGQRYNNVQVGMSTEPSTPVGRTQPVVDGNIITWVDDGWYQVQNSTDYTTLCEGGRECEVPAGTYHVINLSSGMRFENIIVGSVEPDPSEPGAEPMPVPTSGEFYPSILSISDTTVLVPEVPADASIPENAQQVGDVNGDGLIDLMIILEGEQTYQRSAAVLFANALNSYPDLPLNENLITDTSEVLTHGFIINDVGTDIGGVGDINNDGFDDLSLLSSGYFAVPTRFVLAGAADFSARIGTSDIASLQVLVNLPVNATLVNAGDISGDGIEDLFVTAPNDVRGAVIYGANNLDITYSTRQALQDESVFPGCADNFCSMAAIGDFDGDGMADIYGRRFGARGCGFAGFAVVLYGQAGGIEQANAIYEYAPGDVTRIVDEPGADCFSGSIMDRLSGNDIDGDGATDLFLGSRLEGDVGHLVFGTSDRRREFLSTADLDGQLGLSISGIDDIEVFDSNNDGFDDIVFDNVSSYLGHARNISSVDGPVVRRSPTSFVINVANSLTSGGERLSISINNVPAGEFDVGTVDITIDNFIGTAEAVVDVVVLSSDDETLTTLRRVVPEFFTQERVTADLLAPRLVELTLNANTLITYYSHYLVWRNGVPIGRSINGADNFIDNNVELGRTYTYYITPDYLYDDSFDVSLMRQGPLLQRQSNSVSVTTPAP